MREELERLFADGHGLPLIPIAAGTKYPVRGFDLRKVLAGQVKVGDTRHYFERDPSLNYAVPCLGGYFVLDFDDLKNYLLFFPQHQELEAQTMVVASPHGGVHVWLRSSYEGATVRRSVRISEKLDLLGEGGYAIGPGSVVDHTLCHRDKHGCPHVGTGEYRIIESSFILEANALTQYNDNAGIAGAIRTRAKELGWQVNSQNECSPIHKIAKGVGMGERNVAGFRLARYLLYYVGIDEETAWEQMGQWNERNTPSLQEDELRHLFGSAHRYPYPVSRPDEGRLQQRFVKLPRRGRIW